MYTRLLFAFNIFNDIGSTLLGYIFVFMYTTYNGYKKNTCNNVTKHINVYEVASCRQYIQGYRVNVTGLYICINVYSI